jgi:hypothetical protein
MMLQLLIDLGAQLLRGALALLPVVALPVYDLAPALPLLDGLGAILPTDALRWTIAVALVLNAARLGLAVWRFIRTVGAP